MTGTAVVDQFVLAISVAACILNIGMIVYYSVLTRRLRRLNILLGQLVIRAFVQRHLPYWKPWAQIYGYDLRMTVSPVSEREETDE